MASVKQIAANDAVFELARAIRPDIGIMSLREAVMIYTKHNNIKLGDKSFTKWLYLESGLGVGNEKPKTKVVFKKKKHKKVRLANIPKQIGAIYNIPTGKKEEKSFYLSKPWRNLRKLVIETYGCACMKCGFRNSRNHVDHIYPRSIYSHLELSFCNMQVLCKTCNELKGNTEIYDVRPQKYQKLKDELLLMVIDSSFTANKSKQI